MPSQGAHVHHHRAGEAKVCRKVEEQDVCGHQGIGVEVPSLVITVSPFQKKPAHTDIRRLTQHCCLEPR